MTEERTAALLTGGLGLLERAISYTLGSLLLVTPDAMARPTPCREWDLHALLAHMNESLRTLHEAVAVGHLDLQDPTEDRDRAVDPVAALRSRACRMMGDWHAVTGENDISIASRSLPTGIVTSAGALEVVVHGWDVARACGEDRPIPVMLADELLDLAPLFVSYSDRPTRFAPPVRVSRWDPPSHQLLAFLGRDPR